MFRFLQTSDIKYLECVPSRVGGSFYEITSKMLTEFSTKLADHNLKPVSMQGLLHNSTKLMLFGSKQSRQKMLELLKRGVEICNELSIPNLVFGSPKNRKIPEGLSYEESHEISMDFFSEIGSFAAKHGCKIAIEANAKEYGTNFITNHTELFHFISEVNSDGITANFDLSTMILNNENINQIDEKTIENISHIHISSPYLKPMSVPSAELDNILNTISSFNYDKFVSLEMVGENIKETKEIITNLNKAVIHA
ncbi:sugar phosphate isomerase/epimerase [bacterium]|nr:sugar phosphate isomerase/epimerase [bacterium]